MKFKSLFILAVLSIVLASCGAKVSIGYDYDRNVDFSKYKTYNFHEKGIGKMEMSDLDKRRIVSAIETNMEAKGFKKSEDNPDLLVNILASSKENVVVDNWGMGFMDPFWGMPNNVYQYTSGKLIFDIIDNDQNILVWQGTASGMKISNKERKEEDLTRAVNRAFANFPPPSSRK